MSVSFRDTDFLHDLVSAVPLFVREGDAHRWAHKSIQEYFAAKFICADAKGKQEAILRKMCQSSEMTRYFNVIDLCYDIDYKTFRNSVIYDLVTSYIEYFNSSYTSINRDKVAEESISERKALAFAGNFIIYPSSFLKASNTAHEIFEKVKSHAINAGWLRHEMQSTISVWSWHGAGLFAPNNHYGLITILKDKNDPLALHVPRKRNDALMKLSSAYQNPVLVDERPDSPVNKHSAFSSINDFMSVFVKEILCYQSCLKMKKEIERDLKQMKEEEFLISSI